MGMNRGRPPHPEPVTPAEAKVLELVREGLHNAEIAVRLGLSVNTVRYHVSNLLTKAGIESREGLAKWDPGHRRRWRWLALPAALPKAASVVAVGTGVSFAAVVAVAAIVLTHAGSGSRPPDSTLPSPDAPSATADTTPGWPTRTIDGSTFVDIGPLIAVNADRSGGVETIDQRASATIISLKGSATIHFAGPHMEQVHNGATYGEGTNGKSPIAINVWPTSDSTTLAPITGGGEAVEASRGGRPEFMIWVTETRGVGQNTRGLSLYRSVIDASGELFVSVEPIPPAEAIDGATGEAVDLSGGSKIGELSPIFGATRCAELVSCRVSWLGAPLPAPSDGTVRCADGTTFEFEDSLTNIRILITPFNG
ncbi:MAG: helix-turn-helix domain-containing protein, partial [Tepidiformaceae bacterium]